MNRIHQGLISILLLFSVLAPASPRWELHDVSVLFPLPSLIDQNPMARNEELLPKIWVEQFPRLSVRYDQPTLLRQSTIVSMRIDVYTNQVKLVWQPIIMNGQKNTTTIDAAFHSFYQLTPAEFESFTQKLFKYIKDNTKDTYSLEPLNIHPLFSQATAENSKRHMNFMRALIDQYLTSKNVFKVTTMVLRAADDFWGFLGFELKKGSPAPQPIVIANAEKSTVQTFLNQAVPFDHFVNIAISPLQSPTEDSFVDSLLGYVMTTRNAETLTEEQIEKTVRSIRKMENPELMHVDKMDCASCHAAQPILDYLRLTLKEKFNDSSDTLYKNGDYNLSSVHTDINTRRIRGFGYFGSEVAISDRAINESAQNATEMNKKLTQKTKGRRK